MSLDLNRRSFLRHAALGIGGVALPSGPGPAATAGSLDSPPPIIDTHTHFYDPSRPAGVPWPPKDDPVLYRTVFPRDYRMLEKPAFVAGTVVVEASPWVEDNQWILDLAAHEPFIVGFVGNLPVGTDRFVELLDRFAAAPLFRGVRLQGSRLRAGLEEARFLADLRLLSRRELSLDVVGTPGMLADVARLAEVLPDLPIVIDHVAGVRVDGAAPPAEWLRGVRATAARSNVCCKVSGLVEGTGRTGGQAPLDPARYRPVLDAVWNQFGEDRLIYGSNWPVCELFAKLATVQRVAMDYFAAKGRAAVAKVFAQNARRVYRCVDRSPA